LLPGIKTQKSDEVKNLPVFSKIFENYCTGCSNFREISSPRIKVTGRIFMQFDLPPPPSISDLRKKIEK
jgi:hypothetical protein